MGTLTEDLSAIKTIQDGLVNNKVARFSYTQKAYIDNIVDGVDTYNVNNEQNIPNGTADIMKVNDTIINKGYRAQASSITRMLMNHFLGRISYNLNKVNDNMLSLLQSITTNLGNVVNTGDSATPVSGGTTKFTTGGAYTELNKKNDKITITANETSVYDGTGVVLKGTSTETNPTSMEVRPVSVIWDYIKSKADSIYVKLSQLSDISGKANGIATLDANAKLPQTQLPDILGKANGIATLDANAKLPQTQLPDILGKANGIATLDSDGKLKLEQSPVSRFTLIKAFKNITGTGSSKNLGVITPDGLDYLPVGLYMINISGGSGEEFYLPFAILEIKTQVESIYFDDRFKTEIYFRPDGGKIKPFLYATFSSSYPAKIYIYKIG